MYPVLVDGDGGYELSCATGDWVIKWLLSTLLSEKLVVTVLVDPIEGADGSAKTKGKYQG